MLSHLHALCPTESVTRVACVGDSLTNGDSLQSYKPFSVGRCSWSDPLCRGNYPMVLGSLLGPRYDVRNFGVIGWPACGRLPSACIESGGTSSTNATLPLSSAADGTALAVCVKAFGETQLLRSALEFKPHVAVLMLGTNDAMGTNWDRCGLDGFERSFALVLRVLFLSANSPFILVLEPPPVLGEIHPDGVGCMATRLCRFQPKTCHKAAECTSCAPEDVPDRGSCVWVHPLRKAR